ncbi:MAG: hypothetical protein M5U22_22845 [Thermoleophilia bacterium]|nr:hypothetical protein [Thermoleophilia bacterium]
MSTEDSAWTPPVYFAPRERGAVDPEQPVESQRDTILVSLAERMRAGA